MTQTSTLPITAQILASNWTEPRRDKYGRPRIELMATVIKDGDDTARWQTCVVLTTLPKACAPERYMTTDWMAAPFIDGVRQARTRTFAKRAEAKAYGESLVVAQLAKNAAAPTNARLWA